MKNENLSSEEFTKFTSPHKKNTLYVAKNFLIQSIIKGKFIVNVVIKALPAALTDFIVVAVVSITGEILKIPHDNVSTMITFIILMVGMLTLVRVCKPFDFIRSAVCICMLLGIIFSVMFLRPLFALQILTGSQLLITVIGMACTIPLFIGLCYLVEMCADRFRRIKGF